MERKRWLLGALIAGLALMLFGNAALAQTGGTAPTENWFPIPEDQGLNYTITMGAAIAVSSNINNSTSATVGVAWYGAGSENLGTMSALGLSGDWIAFQRNDGKDVQIVPVMFNYRRYGLISNYRVFVNLGVGILAVTDSIPEMKLSNGASFGWTGGLGIDLTNRFYGQARFIGGENPGDDGMVAIEFGYRF